MPCACGRIPTSSTSTSTSELPAARVDARRCPSGRRLFWAAALRPRLTQYPRPPPRLTLNRCQAQRRATGALTLNGCQVVRALQSFRAALSRRCATKSSVARRAGLRVGPVPARCRDRAGGRPPSAATRRARPGSGSRSPRCPAGSPTPRKPDVAAIPAHRADWRRPGGRAGPTPPPAGRPAPTHLRGRAISRAIRGRRLVLSLGRRRPRRSMTAESIP
jgi:hypothetical protein